MIFILIGRPKVVAKLPEISAKMKRLISCCAQRKELGWRNSSNPVKQMNNLFSPFLRFYLSLLAKQLSQTIRITVEYLHIILKVKKTGFTAGNCMMYLDGQSGPDWEIWEEETIPRAVH